MNTLLQIKNLSVSLGEKSLLNDINMEIADGARALLRGANGSGKTTLAQTIAGNPDYHIDNGTIIFDGRDMAGENATTRALMGIFLGAQNVPEIPGLSVMSFLRHSMIAHTHFQTGKELSAGEFFQKLKIACERLDIPESWLTRSINVGFSGGERKRLAFLHMLMVQPKLAILDEPDSGVDGVAQKLFAEIIGEMNKTTFLIISHQEKFADLLGPTQIISLKDGRIVI